MHVGFHKVPLTGFKVYCPDLGFPVRVSILPVFRVPERLHCDSLGAWGFLNTSNSTGFRDTTCPEHWMAAKILNPKFQYSQQPLISKRWYCDCPNVNVPSAQPAKSKGPMRQPFVHTATTRIVPQIRCTLCRENHPTIEGLVRPRDF